VRLYDVTTRQQIGVPFPKRSVYGQASLSADGRTLVTSGSGGMVIWDTDPRSWARRACAAAGRNLTRAEWERFLPDTGYRRTCPPSGRRRMTADQVGQPPKHDLLHRNCGHRFFTMCRAAQPSAEAVP
jgi:hypothetical protein